MLTKGLKNGLCSSLLVLAMFGQGACYAAGQQEHVSYLPSGKQIMILALGPAVGNGGKTKAIMLRYRSQVQTMDKDAVSKEVDDVWDLFRIDADHSGMTAAVISAELPATDPQAKHVMNFILEKDQAGNWVCRNDKLVTVGTPAKIAYRQAFKLFTQRRNQDALAYYNKSIELDPSYVQAYVDRGGLYNALNELERSLADSNTAIRLMPKNAGALCNRGIVQVKLGKYKEGIDDLTSALALNPDLGLCYTYRGIALLKTTQYDRAVDDFNKAISMKARLAETYYNRGLALEKIAENNKKVGVQLGYHPADAKAVSQRINPRSTTR